MFQDAGFPLLLGFFDGLCTHQCHAKEEAESTTGMNDTLK
jgi:hypothetical protein